ncbi:hypothetical protein HEK616_83780 (plasmid) [Streptomyces nigrescens]|uniref:Transcriptional regulator n=1 Tax=Streptomyces nigrescens TaxID=1920 RepID=A0ABM8A8B2_STRNI|nr:transcriptional regulator [Streptomyces nigrescens]BDM74871.1 hypothetical protein HEK616_83580 [Streptomyces nigrescens]BDM74891.1 hypothetical protein HEK616_83780 [Streptomyces nigrescens]
MKRRAVLSAGVGACAAVAVAGGTPAWAGEAPTLRAEDVAAARRMFTHGRYDQLRQRLSVLLATAHGSAMNGPVGVGRAAQLLVLASQLAVKQGRIDDAAIYADTAVITARRSGRPVLLAAAARAAATPLRRTGRTDQALRLLDEARTHLTDTRPTASVLDAAGMLALTAAYTAAQAHLSAPALHFAALAEETADQLTRLAAAPTEQTPWELSAPQCTLYRIGVHRELGDPDIALTHARRLSTAELPTAERRARAATDTARALLATGDVTGAFAQLQHVKAAAPQEARRPSLRALTAELTARRPDLAVQAPGITGPAAQPRVR